ncbi:Uncharacterized protein PBTT_06155 [Plasmodiophora brassicae]
MTGREGGRQGEGSGRPLPMTQLRRDPTFLQPMLEKVVKNVDRKHGYGYGRSNDDTVLRDTFGNRVYVGHTETECWRSEVLDLLKRQQEDSVEIDDIDKGRLFYTLQKVDGVWILIQTCIDLHGDAGFFTDYIVVDDFDKLHDHIKDLDIDDDSTSEDGDDQPGSEHD